MCEYSDSDLSKGELKFALANVMGRSDAFEERKRESESGLGVYKLIPNTIHTL